MSSNQYFDEVKEFALDHWHDSNVRIYLFGSWARGEQKRSSDVDIAVEPLADFTGDFEEKIGAFQEALEESTIIYNVDVVNLNFVADALKRQILKEGILWKN